jgi:UDP:flavonoid glycosyltransferase YjiC (YdhE family)
MEGDINLLCDLPDLFPQKKLPLNYYFTAPLYYQARASRDDIIDKLDKSKKTLFISMGSTGDWQKAAFLNHPYFNAYNIVTAGDTSRVINGEHVISEVFVDIHTLHRNIDLVICHGGNGTIYQALSYGIPLLCISNHFEQEWNVYAIEKNRLGKSLDPITTVEEHFSLIEEWAARKNEVHLQLYSTKIQEAKEAFPKTINHIISTLSITPDEKFSMLNRFHRRA